MRRFKFFPILILATACGRGGSTTTEYGFAEQEPTTSVTRSAPIGMMAQTVFHMYKIPVHTNGFQGGISGADSLCQTNQARPTSNNYKAFLVDGWNRVACFSANCDTLGNLEHTGWVLRPNSTYVRVDETVIATTNSKALFNLSATNSIGTYGALWTGMQDNWTSSSENCDRWTSGISTGMQGSMVQTDSRLLSDFAISCAATVGLICVEQP